MSSENNYLYALLSKNMLIGLFDNEESLNNMYEGLYKNNLLEKRHLTIKKYVKNSLNTIEGKTSSLNDSTHDVLIGKRDLSKEEMKEKADIEYELNMLKKKKEEIEESKKVFPVDLELYRKFKKIKENNNNFEIPDLFSEKYSIFEMLERDDKMDWENFYLSYSQNNGNTGYDKLFDSQSAREELLL